MFQIWDSPERDGSWSTGTLVAQPAKGGLRVAG